VTSSWSIFIQQFPEVFAIPWRAISKKLGLIVAQSAKKFIFLKVKIPTQCRKNWTHTSHLISLC